MGRIVSGALTLLFVASVLHESSAFSGQTCKNITSSKEKCQNTSFIFVQNQMVFKGELNVTFKTSGQMFSWYCGSSRRDVILAELANQARVYYRKNEEVEITIEDCHQVQLQSFNFKTGSGKAVGTCYDEDFSYTCLGIEGKTKPCTHELTVIEKTAKVSKGSAGVSLKIIENLQLSLSGSNSKTDVHTYQYQQKSFFVVPAGYTFCSYRKATNTSVQSYECSGTIFNYTKIGNACSEGKICNKKKRSCFPDKHNISNKPNFHLAFYFVILLVFLFI